MQDTTRHTIFSQRARISCEESYFLIIDVIRLRYLISSVVTGKIDKNFIKRPKKRFVIVMIYADDLNFVDS